MKIIWRWFIWLLVLAGFPLLAWAVVYLSADTYSFWRHGVEKRAHVISLDHFTGGKGGYIFYYRVEVDGRTFVKDFRMKLPEGEDVRVLALPNEPEQITLGTSSSGAFEIYAMSIGGRGIAVLTIAMFLFVAFVGPKAMLEWIKNRRKIIGA
jgi:hypothetical protein